MTCGTCGLAFRRAFPTARELDDIYEAAYAPANICAETTDQESGPSANRRYLDLLGRFGISKGARVLDFGAGTGSFVELLRASGMSADGFEFSRNARDYCKLHRGFDLEGDAGRLPAAQYDGVTMIEVIEHLTNLHGTLTRVRATLKRGGIVIVTTPNRLGLRARLDGGRWREARKSFHLFLFTWQSLRHHLAATGFIDIRQINYGSYPDYSLVRRMYGGLARALGMPGTLCAVARAP